MDKPYNDFMWIWLENISKPILIDTKNIIRIRKYKFSLLKNHICTKLFGRIIDIARIIVRNFDRKFIVDHIDRNPLNNIECNLRLAAKSDNLVNKGKLRTLRNKYKGVSFAKNMNKWRAGISYYGQSVCIGYFNTEIEAAKAYDEKAVELHGEFAVTNKKLRLL